MKSTELRETIQTSDTDVRRDYTSIWGVSLVEMTDAPYVEKMKKNKFGQGFCSLIIQAPFGRFISSHSKWNYFVVRITLRCSRIHKTHRVSNSTTRSFTENIFS